MGLKKKRSMSGQKHASDEGSSRCDKILKVHRRWEKISRNNRAIDER
jgi:hypothetical protein